MSLKVNFGSVKSTLASKKDVAQLQRAIELVIDTQYESFIDELTAIKDHVQHQIHDIFVELKSIRKEVVYIASRKKYK